MFEEWDICYDANRFVDSQPSHGRISRAGTTPSIASARVLLGGSFRLSQWRMGRDATIARYTTACVSLGALYSLNGVKFGMEQQR